MHPPLVFRAIRAAYLFAAVRKHPLIRSQPPTPFPDKKGTHNIACLPNQSDV